MSCIGRTKFKNRGVTLVELSIVLVIIGILMQSVIAPLGPARELQRIRTVTKELEIIKQAMISHLMLYGALPCSSFSRPPENTCSHVSGDISAVALGLSGDMDESNALLDPWGRPYRYAISQGEPVWTSVHSFLQKPIDEWQANLILCKRAQSSGCDRTQLRADNIVFVVFSLGADPQETGDQRENIDGDNVFSVRDESIRADEKYDDHITWATQSELLYWLLRAGVM